jgi:hypothetical protein
MNALGQALLTSWVMIAAAMGCSSQVAEPDSETHWLRVCNEDADCEGGLSCWCGLCTTLCTSTSDCSKLPSGAVCADIETANAACMGFATKNACVLPCGTSEPSGTQPCAALGANASCGWDGICRNNSGVLTCYERMAEATKEAYAIVAQADTTCVTDADCVSSTDVLLCAPGCASWAISKTGAAQIAPAIGAADPPVCKFAAECAIPCPRGGAPACVAGKCLLQGPPGCDSCVSELPQTCSERSAQMAALISGYVEATDKSCSTDADCTAVSLSTDCNDHCPAAVSQTAASALTTALQGIETSFCPNFVHDGCEVARGTGTCLLTTGADGGTSTKCVSGLCQ